MGKKNTQLIEELGGLEDNVKDVFGIEMDMCSEKDGMDRLMRYSVLRHRLVGNRAPQWVPQFTREGWKVMDVPSHLVGMLAMARIRGKAEQEVCLPEISAFNCQRLVEEGEECRLEHSGKQEILQLDSQLKETVLSTLLPLAEEWASVSLVGTSVYGIRRYKKGGWLTAHVDQMATHVISAIINVGQEGEPWPLYILDHEGQTNKVHLSPGQMVWYESAKLQHARPEPFNGKFFDNIFVHFKPRDRRWYGSDVMQVKYLLKKNKI